MAGLRYLLTTNNINWETPAPGAVLLTTNFGGYTFLTTSNLNALLVASQTNAPGLIPGLFPGVTVTSSTTNFGVLYTPITATTVTTLYGTPYPGVPVIGIVTNGYYLHPDAPVFGHFWRHHHQCQSHQHAQFPAERRQRGVELFHQHVRQPRDGFAGDAIRFAVSRAGRDQYHDPDHHLTNAASGEYFTIPAGQCGWTFMSPQPNGYPLTNVVASTNLIATVTNTSTGASNSVGFVGSVSMVTYFTNHTYVAAPVICGQTTTNPPGLYEGIGQVQFVEADYDSLLGQYWRPVTNNYTMTLVTNSQTVVQQLQRVLTAPDFLFTAVDSANAPLLGSRNLNFNQANILPGLAGPGTIDPATTITLNKGDPFYYNAYSDTMDGTPYFTELPGSDIADSFYGDYYLWASYDGTTNVPVVYPNGTSIDNLGNMIMIKLSPASLVNGFSERALWACDHHRNRRRLHTALHVVGHLACRPV